MPAQGVGRLADRPVDVDEVAIRIAGGIRPCVAAVIDRASERGQGDDRMTAVVERRPDQLRHPGVDDDHPPAPVADMQDGADEPARSRDQETTRLDRQPRGAAVDRDGLEQVGDLAGEPLRSRTDIAEGRDREPAPEVERVEPGQASAQEGDERESPADRVPPGVDGPQLRPDVEVDPAPAQRPFGAAPGLDRARQLVVGQAELARARADREPVECLRLDGRVEPEQDVEPVDTRPASDPGQGRGFVGGLDRDPAQRPAVRGRTRGGPQVRVGLADPLERDPVVRDPGSAGDRPFAARHDIRPESDRADPGDQPADVVRLDRVLADPRIGERGTELLGGPRQPDGVGQGDGRAEPPSGVTERLGQLGEAIVLRHGPLRGRTADAGRLSGSS